MALKSLLPPKVRIPLEVGLWWKRNEIGKWLLSKQHRKERRARKRRLRELGIEEVKSVAVYNKLIVAVVGSLLTLASKWIPALEGADAALLVEAVLLALTALGVYAVPNKPAK